MAMVKANAYGHGLRDIVAILEKYCNWFGVANVNEALQVKNILHSKKNILVVGKCENYYQLINNGIHFTIDSINEIDEIDRICCMLNSKACIHIAINTGMNRFGVKSTIPSA